MRATLAAALLAATSALTLAPAAAAAAPTHQHPASFARAWNGCTHAAAATVGPQGGRPDRAHMRAVVVCWRHTLHQLHTGQLVQRLPRAAGHPAFRPAVHRPGTLPAHTPRTYVRLAPAVERALRLPAPCGIHRGPTTTTLLCRGGFWSTGRS
jgi:hypothetical protein